MASEDKDASNLRILMKKEDEAEKVKIRQYSLIREVNDQALTQQIQHKRRLSQITDEHTEKLSKLKGSFVSEIEEQKHSHFDIKSNFKL